MRWYADFEASGRTGLSEPAACAAELDRFFEEEDEVATWLAERCVKLDADSEPRGWTIGKDLYNDYTAWRFTQGASGQPLSSNTFGRRLQAKGFDVKVVWSDGKTARVRPLRLASAIAGAV